MNVVSQSRRRRRAAAAAMSRRLTKALISAVRVRPCLWHNGDTDYTNKEIRYKAWEEVAKMLFPDSDQKTDRKCGEVKRKWANIRDSYRKEYHRSRGSGEAETGKPKREYIFSDMLTFLRPVLKRRRAPPLENSVVNGGTVVDAMEGDGEIKEDSFQSTPPALSKQPRTDPGVSIPVDRVQDHAPAHHHSLVSNSSSLLSSQSIEGSAGNTGAEGVGGGGGGAAPEQQLLHQQKQKQPPARAAKNSASRQGPVPTTPPPSPLAPNLPPPAVPPPPSFLTLHPLCQQLPQHHPGCGGGCANLVREQDSDLSFLYSFLPDMRSMSELQKMDFKIGIMKLMHDIKFPGALPSGLRVQVQHSNDQGPSGSAQAFAENARSTVVYVTENGSIYSEEEEECESGLTMKTER